MRDAVDRVQKIITAIDRAMATGAVVDTTLLTQVQADLTALRSSLVVTAMTEEGRSIARDIDARFGTDPIHALIGQHLYESGYRVTAEHPTEPAPALDVPADDPTPAACIDCGHAFDEHSDEGCGVLICTCHRRPRGRRLYRPRLLACIEAWPEAESGEYDPRCCRFPKSCSADVYSDVHATPDWLEPAS